MDAFYASVEQRDDPALRGKPVIVGGRPNGRGVVAACSYEARKFGVHSAMPSREAQRRCPEAVFVRPRFDVYRDVSQQIREVFLSFTPLVEPLSLDEAYLDVSGVERAGGSAIRMAREIKQTIRADTGLVASAGVSYNKFLAKIASDYDKPDGLYCILPEDGEAFVASLPIGRFHGIGRVMESRMRDLGIHVGADLRAWSMQELDAEFGRSASWYHAIARGIDPRPVRTSRERKSLGAERTFGSDLHDEAEMLTRLQAVGEKVIDDLAGKSLSARTLTIKVRFNDFETLTRAWTVDPLRLDAALLADILPVLLARALAERHARGVRLLGVSVSGLVDTASLLALPTQLCLSFD